LQTIKKPLFVIHYYILIATKRIIWHFIYMARETIILECTEARKEGKQPSRYMASRNKKLQTEPVEKKKFNRFLRRHTMHKEIKS